MNRGLVFAAGVMGVVNCTFLMMAGLTIPGVWSAVAGAFCLWASLSSNG